MRDCTRTEGGKFRQSWLINDTLLKHTERGGPRCSTVIISFLKSSRTQPRLAGNPRKRRILEDTTTDDRTERSPGKLVRQRTTRRRQRQKFVNSLVPCRLSRFILLITGGKFRWPRGSTGGKFRSNFPPTPPTSSPPPRALLLNPLRESERRPIYIQ